MSLPMETREIGSVKEIDIEQMRVIFHKSGNPAEIALMLKDLMNRGLNQTGISKLLEVNQAQVSRFLKLLSLTPKLFERVLAGEIKARTGYQLARLPKEKQVEFEGVKKVTMKVSEEAVREMVLNKDVISLIKDFEDEEPIKVETTYGDIELADNGGKLDLFVNITELMKGLGPAGLRALKTVIEERLK